MAPKQLFQTVARSLALHPRYFLRSDPPLCFLLTGLAGCAALGLGGCAQPAPQRYAYAHGKEYFPSSIYGPASPRVVADGEPVPRGGGMYMVGKPYTIAGRTYYPSDKRYTAVGVASWYGDAFHGRRTANGEVYDRDGISAAHPTMPLPSYARVTNLKNHYSMIVRVNDRGPFAGNRIMDVSRRTAEVLDFDRGGTAKVKIEYLGAAELEGSDDQILLATLRSDGPARVAGLGLAEPELPPRNIPAVVAKAEDLPLSSGGKAEESSKTAPASGRPGLGRIAPLPPPRPPGGGAIRLAEKPKAVHWAKR